MPNLAFQTLPSSDDAVIEALKSVWRDFDSPAAATYSVQLMDGNLPAVTGPFAALDENEAISELRSVGTAALRSITLGLQTNHQPYVSVTRGAGADQINVGVSDGILPAGAAKFMASVRRAFREYTPTPTLDRVLGPELAEFYREREGTLGRLEDLTRDLVRQGVEARQQLDERGSAERQALLGEVEEERRRMAAVLERKEAELRQREDALAAQLKVLDDRGNTYARRQLRDSLKSDLAKRNTAFALTKGTAQKRWPIHGLFLTLLAASGALAVRALLKSDVDTSLLAFARFAVGVLSFIGALAFYIRWNDRWAQAHADEEFRLKRLDLDVDRASWVVETALEWKEEKGSTIPPELLERLTSSLFVDGARAERVKHPSEDVFAALLRASAGMRVSIPGFGELTFDRKGVRQLEKGLAESARGDGA